MRYTKRVLTLVLLFGIAGVVHAGQWKLVGCSLQWEGNVVGTKENCYNKQTLRSTSVLSTCPAPLEKSGALCYPKCRTGYYGVGPVCWQSCPAGYSDDGAFCRRNARIIGADNGGCPWYDKCGLTFSKGCSRCPAGYSNDGCTCRIDAHIFAKGSYGRGVGSPLGCAPGQQQIAALCYGSCPSGWRADGILCKEINQTCETVVVREPEDRSKLRQFCFRLKQNTWCSVQIVWADTAENARVIAQCQCTNCSVEQIDCSQQTTACSR